ncbi:MAG: PAS domain-containing protein [Wolinella sp.]
MARQVTQIEKEFGDREFIVSKTDLKGNITYGNEIFIQLSGYSESELIGAPHNIIRHPDMPRCVFKLLWDCIQSGEEINAYVKNLAKHGEFYWVFANVTPSFDQRGNIIGYYSVRRKPNKSAIETISSIYKLLLEAEKSGGIKAGERLLNNFLHEKNTEYDEFILSLV